MRVKSQARRVSFVSKSDLFCMTESLMMQSEGWKEYDEGRRIKVLTNFLRCVVCTLNYLGDFKLIKMCLLFSTKHDIKYFLGIQGFSKMLSDFICKLLKKEYFKINVKNTRDFPCKQYL